MLLPQSLGPDDAYKAGFNAGYAVMFFYVISGFLITFTLRLNYERDFAGTAAFYRNRFIRIYSLYWPLVILSFLMIGGTWSRFVAAGIWDKFTGVFLFGMDWRVAFAGYPATHYDAAIGGLHQAWTLGAEMTFYLLAPLLMSSWKIGATLLAASLALRAYFVVKLGTDLHDVWTYHFIGTTFCFFMLGHLVGLLGQRLARPLIGILLLFCSFGFMAFGGSYGSYDTLRLWGSVLLFTLCLPGLFEATKNIRWMNHIGDLSYPLYLVHTSILILFGPFIIEHVLPLKTLDARTSAYVSVAVYLAVAIAASFIVHNAIERPVARLMRSMLPIRQVRAA